MFENETFSAASPEKQLKPTCVYAVSTGKEYHEGEELAKHISFFNPKFSHLTIVNTDSLQRHTLQIVENLAPDEAYEEALKRGKDWEARNQKYLDKLEIPYEIVRWDTLRETPEFSERLSAIENFYQKNKRFFKAVNKAAGSFVRSCELKGLVQKENLDKCIKISQNYIKEECAGTLLFGSPDFLAYPRELNGAIKFVCELLQQENPNIMRLIAINSVNANTKFFAASQPRAINSTVDSECIRIYKNMFLTQLDSIWIDPSISPDSKKQLIEELIYHAKQKLTSSIQITM
jgi:tRNA-dependent cyclodipeptide synthase